MDDGLDQSMLDSADVAAGLRIVMRSSGVSSDDQAWKVLVAEPPDDPTMLFIAVGRWTADSGPAGDTSPYARLQRDGDRWRATGWGTCNLEPALDDGSSWADLARAEPRGATADSTAVDVEVSERECTSARDPSAYLREPYVVETETSVTLYWTTDSPSGNQDCPGNPAVTRTVQLGSPLGDRSLYDGSVWPPRLLIRGIR
jgi:hypothetical protein